jgi:hypothetical protein
MGATAKVLNFEGVSEGSEFRPRRKPEGDYYATITAVKDHKSGKTGDEMWCFTVKVHGDARAAYPYYVGLDADSLWKARGLFVAAGIKVPPKRLKADPNKVVGKVIGIALVDDEYEGRPKSTIDAIFPADDMDDPLNERSGKATSTKAKSRAAEEDDDIEDDEDEEPAKPVRNKGKTKAKAVVEDDDEDDDDDDDEPPAKAKGKSKAKAKPVEDDDEDDEDDDEPPVKAKKGKDKSAKGKSKKKPVDDDDDDELDLYEL